MAVLPGIDAMPPGELVNHQETTVVASALIGWAGIADAKDDAHTGILVGSGAAEGCIADALSASCADDDVAVNLLPLLALAAGLAAADLQPADLGALAPELAGLQWTAAGPPPARTTVALVFWAAEDGADQPALSQARAWADRAAVGLVCDGAGEAADRVSERVTGVHHAIGSAKEQIRWLGSIHAPLPAAVLIGADGILLWRGPLTGLQAMLARECAAGFDRPRLAKAASLRTALRAALAAEAKKGSLEQALALTGQLLALEPVDEEGVRLRLDLCRHLARRDLHRETLAGLPLDRLPAELASALAWDRATDEDLAWRHPDLALRLAEHAHQLAPDDAGVEDSYARVLSILGRFDDAVAAELRAVSLAPDDQSMHDALDYYREVQALSDEVRRQHELPKP